MYFHNEATSAYVIILGVARVYKWMHDFLQLKWPHWSVFEWLSLSLSLDCCCFQALPLYVLKVVSSYITSTSCESMLPATCCWPLWFLMLRGLPQVFFFSNSHQSVISWWQTFMGHAQQSAHHPVPISFQTIIESISISHFTQGQRKTTNPNRSKEPWLLFISRRSSDPAVPGCAHVGHERVAHGWKRSEDIPPKTWSEDLQDLNWSFPRHPPSLHLKLIILQVLYSMSIQDGLVLWTHLRTIS